MNSELAHSLADGCDIAGVAQTQPVNARADVHACSLVTQRIEPDRVVLGFLDGNERIVVSHRIRVDRAESKGETCISAASAEKCRGAANQSLTCNAFIATDAIPVSRPCTA